MRKFIAALLSLVMILSITAAFAETYTADGYFTIEYPDTLLLDDTTYVDESTEDNVWLFLLEGVDFVIDAYLTPVEEYAGFSLSAADEADKQAYVDEVMETFAEQQPELMNEIVSDAGILFYVFYMVDENGAYLYAETIEDGLSVNFICYYFDYNVIPDLELVDTLELVLSSYAPDVAPETVMEVSP